LEAIMAKWKLFNRTFDARPDRIDFRDLPYRPRLVSLPDRYPAPDVIKTYFPKYRAASMILDQGEEGSCTGFGLAAVVNYLRWERWIGEHPATGKSRSRARVERISARMFYQNARLYDEWKGEDYDGSSCRGAMKGFHKHGVCTEAFWPNFEKDGREGRARDGWDANAPLTPLGAYYRIDSRSLVDLQSAINETHAIYVSADAHDGWDNLHKCKSLEAAEIRPQRKKEVGGHAFAIVGYTSDGFIIQNSWGPDWGYHGFALLPYEDWVKNGNDAWTLALGAPMAITLAAEKKNKPRQFRSPAASTEISLDERLRIRRPLFAGRAADPSAAPPWINGEEAHHIIFIGHGGRADRELVAAASGDDAVRRVIDGVRDAMSKGVTKVAIYDHGGLNSRDDGVKRAQILGPWFEKNGIHPIFVIWQTGFFESAADILRIAAEKLGLAPERVEGWLMDKLADIKDRAFEVFAREGGVKAIWENMKSRAAGASTPGGGLMTAAMCLRSIGDALNKNPEIHLLGHSAGAIMHGNFLAALQAQALTAASVHLWAPACTVGFANATYGQAFAANVADPASTFVSILSNDNERSDPCVPLYSKSLLYLVSRALEADHNTPVLGMQKAWLPWRKKDATFAEEYWADMLAWDGVAKKVKLDPPVVAKTVPTRNEGDAYDTIKANHGSFDNNLDVVNLALRRILGKAPKVPVTDLEGF
jgi:papain like protease